MKKIPWNAADVMVIVSFVVAVVWMLFVGGCSNAAFDVSEPLSVGNEDSGDHLSKDGSGEFDSSHDSRNGDSAVGESKDGESELSPETDSARDVEQSDMVDGEIDSTAEESPVACSSPPYSGEGGCWSVGIACDTPGYACCYGCDPVTCKCR